MPFSQDPATGTKVILLNQNENGSTKYPRKVMWKQYQVTVM
jgi:hypothetical protein